MASDDASERASVRTYIPHYQKETWVAEADQLGMTQAEFVRTMVQAGRRSFDFDGESGSESSNPEESGSNGMTPGIEGLETRLVALLDEDSYQSWDKLLAGVTNDVEERLEDALATLQQENQVHYSGRHDGYTLTDDE
ncbi:MAG: DUF5805 domain-containing protein [Halobacteriales archaeon]|nr:DUF5805 domain-containing protein [Halobacteriales archaeon]